MKTTASNLIQLSDYQPYGWDLDQVFLTIKLFESHATVDSELHLKRTGSSTLFLNGEDLTLVSIAGNGKPLRDSQYSVDERGVTIRELADDVVLSIQVTIDPDANTRLEGLYRSNGLYCTQCEAEGFRRITYFPDRPDVSTLFQVRLEADQRQCPVLLSNGDCIEQGALDEGRHYAVFSDPHNKPCYLFALVAGQLSSRFRDYQTAEGRAVKVGIFAEAHNIEKCEFALDSLELSMRWDEKRYGLNYDLNTFNIVAVDHFNAGAMENKGLNIFNAKLVFALPDIATDLDYERIESVVAHEYFHNWSGNRVTCRDWFQLTLKEGLTVFRDQEFTRDERDAACKRIEDVSLLMEHQFKEDAGALSHPIQPKAYEQVNNFYTLTVYEKGAEVVRLYQTILGKAKFRAGLRHYLAKHDGTGATVEDFMQAMGEASNQDLTWIKPWYDKKGTPVLKLKTEQNGDQFSIHLAQDETESPLPIPFVYGVLDAQGNEWQGSECYILKECKATITLSGVPQGAVVSPLRNFSAPVKLQWDTPLDSWLHLLKHDSDDFNRWYAMQQLYRSYLLNQSDMTCVLSAVSYVLDQTDLSEKLCSLLLTPPSANALLSECAGQLHALLERRQALIQTISQQWSGRINTQHKALHKQQADDYEPSVAQIGQRSLKNQLLAYSVHHDETAASKQYKQAGNMNDRLGALSALVQLPETNHPDLEHCLSQFYTDYQHENLMLDQWFALSVASPNINRLSTFTALLTHERFDWVNPNRVRALIGGFMRNLTAFHQPSGAGHAIVAQAIMKVDKQNPMLAARLFGLFDGIQYLSAGQKKSAKLNLEGCLAQGCSENSQEYLRKLISAL